MLSFSVFKYFSKKSSFVFLAVFMQFWCQNSFCVTLNEAIESAKVNNRNIKYFDYKARAAKSDKFVAVAEFLPDISASANYGNKRNDISSGISNSNKERYEELRAEQDVFSGFGSISRYKKSDYKYQSSLAQKNDKQQEIAMMAALTYCDFYRYSELVKLYTQNKEFSQEIIDLARKRQDARLLDNADFIKFNYEAIDIKQKYFDAMTNLAKARADFKNVTAIEEENLLEPKAATEKFERQKVLQNAIANNQNVKSSYYNYLSAKYNHDAQKSELSPKVSVIALASRQRNVVYLNQSDLNTQSFYVNLKVPIFQGGAEYANIYSAGHERSAAKEEYEIAKESVTKEVSKALDDYDFYQEFEKSSKDLSELAKERLQIFEKRTQMKVEDRVEFLRTQIEYNQYLAQCLEASAELTKSYYKIKYYAGEL